jgi:polyhydroxybutyrate depolymerase
MPGRGGRSRRALERVLAGGLAAASLAFVLAGPVVGAEVMGPTAHAPGGRAIPLFSGCGQPPPAVAPSSIEVGGRRRGLITVVPAGYRSQVPHRLVIAFHGRTSSNATARRYFGLERAARGPTIFVYPSGLKRKDGSYSWWERHDPPDSYRDFALFDAVVARISSLYCVDRSQIFAVGHSLGAWFVNNLACARGDVLRAIGTIAGAMSRAECRGEVAAMLFHNPRDRRVSYGWGLAARDLLHAANGDGSRTKELSLGGFACQRYGGAGAPNPVLWCPYTKNRTRSGLYYPHHWPDGAARAMMDFFASLPAAPGTLAVQPVAAGSGGSGSATR